MAALSTVISLIIAVARGCGPAARRPRARRFFDGLTYSRIVLPEVVFALGLLVLFNKLHIAYGVGAIVLGHVVFLSAYATIIIQARLASLSGPWRRRPRTWGPIAGGCSSASPSRCCCRRSLVAALLTISFSL